MAVRAHFTSSSFAIGDRAGTVWRNSCVGEVSTSSCKVRNSLSRIEVQGLRSDITDYGADLYCRPLSKRRGLCCFGRKHGDSIRILYTRRIRAQSFDSGRNNYTDSSLGGSTNRYGHGISSPDDVSSPVRRSRKAGRRRMQVQVRSAVDDPYGILGVSRTATEKEIKQAYRKLALKFHPDVNKQADAQKKFLQIKVAYQTLVDAKSRTKYDASTRASPQWDPFTWETERPPSQKSQRQEEEFYGLGDLFRDVQISLEDFFRDLQSDTRTKEKQDAKPKSLWEELAEIGEEFVEFLEKELNITDANDGDRSSKYRSDYEPWDSKVKNSKEPNIPAEEQDKKEVESEIAEIEEMLAKIKKELGI